MSGSGEPAGAAPNPSATAAAAASAPDADGPAALGFRMPAEWESHERTWMGWPQRPDNWRDRASHAQKAFVDVATAISQFEPVTICANEEQARGCGGLAACRYPHLANCKACWGVSCLDASLPHRVGRYIVIIWHVHPPTLPAPQVAAAREALPPHISVVCIPQDDAWFRDTGPTVRQVFRC